MVIITHTGTHRSPRGKGNPRGHPETLTRVPMWQTRVPMGQPLLPWDAPPPCGNPSAQEQSLCSWGNPRAQGATTSFPNTISGFLQSPLFQRRTPEQPFCSWGNTVAPGASPSSPWDNPSALWHPPCAPGATPLLLGQPLFPWGNPSSQGL